LRAEEADQRSATVLSFGVRPVLDRGRFILSQNIRRHQQSYSSVTLQIHRAAATVEPRATFPHNIIIYLSSVCSVLSVASCDIVSVSFLTAVYDVCA
jgi:hypothetical protein